VIELEIEVPVAIRIGDGESFVVGHMTLTAEDAGDETVLRHESAKFFHSLADALESGQ
jgi:hypothetical protein